MQRRGAQNADQQLLFQTGPRAPRWSELPGNVRVEVARLLAQLLRKYRAVATDRDGRPEVRDE